MLATITGTGTGSPPIVIITFPYIAKEHIKAQAAGLAVPLIWTNTSQVQFGSAVPSGTPWKVYRETPTSPALVDFQDGSPLSEADLDLAETAHRYRDEELLDLIAQREADFGRSVRAPEGEALNPLPSFAVRSGKALVFDQNGDVAVSPMDFTVTGAAGQTVQTRPALAAIVGPLADQSAVLTEAGRQGRFLFKTGDHSALVASDPYQGIYVAPASDPSGSSGAWVRDVDDLTYLASWWGISAAASDNHAQLQNVLFGSALLPSGATFKLPAGVIKTSAQLLGRKDDITIEGEGWGVTQLLLTVAGLGVIGMWGNNITIRKMRITGLGEAAFANGSDSLGLGNDNTATQYSNWLVEDVWMDGAGIGLIVTASQDNTTIYRATGVTVRRCKFSSKGQGFSIFGCDNVLVEQCELDMPDTPANNETEGFRILGSTNVRVIDVHGRGPGQFGIRIDQMNRAKADNSGTFTLDNSDILIKDVHITNAAQVGVMAQTCKGKLRIENCIIEGIAGGNPGDNSAVVLNATGTPGASFEDVAIVGCEFLSYNAGLNFSGAAVTSLRWDTNKVVGNTGSSTYPTSVAVRTDSGSFTLLEILNSQFLLPNNGAMADIRIGAADPSQTVRVIGNTFMEAPGGYLVHMPFATDAGATVQVTSGDYNLTSPEGADAGGILGTVVSDNTRYNAGVFAALT